jgi:hypothetical protein
MKVIENKLNKELLNIIEPFSTWFFEQDRSLIILNGETDQDEYHTNPEYLRHMQSEEQVTGFPEKTFGTDLARSEVTPISWRPMIRELDNNLNAFFGSKFGAVKMYYPVGGFMGWHHNANCPGYNILLSFTKTGKGFFRYQDPITKEIMTIGDQNGGWTAKVGYYGSWEEKDKIYWHSARAYEERLTLGYVIPNEDFWNMMVDDLTD